MSQRYLLHISYYSPHSRPLSFLSIRALSLTCDFYFDELNPTSIIILTATSPKEWYQKLKERDPDKEFLVTQVDLNGYLNPPIQKWIEECQIIKREPISKNILGGI